MSIALPSSSHTPHSTIDECLLDAEDQGERDGFCSSAYTTRHIVGILIAKKGFASKIL